MTPQEAAFVISEQKGVLAALKVMATYWSESTLSS